MVFYGGIVAQRKRGFQSSFRRQPGRRRRKALLPGNGQRKGCGPSFGSLPGGMGGYVPVGDEGCDGPADLAPTLGVYCLRRSEERSDAPQAQPPPSKFHFEIWDAGYGDPYLTSFRKGRCLYWPADRHSRCSRRGRALPRPARCCRALRPPRDRPVLMAPLGMIFAATHPSLAAAPETLRSAPLAWVFAETSPSIRRGR